MPIFNLTNAPKAFMKLGAIRKGDRKGTNGAPRDLDHFRVTFQPGKLEKELAAAFLATYGPNPTEINVRFADSAISEIWDANLECYKQGGLIAKAGTNEKSAYWIFYRDPETSEVLVRDGSPVGSAGRDFFEKPVDIEAPIYFNSKKEPFGLEPVGRLQVVIPELAGIAVGFFTFQPQSPRDIRNVTAELAAFDAIARASGKSITGIPFKLIRREEEVTKKINNKLSKGPSWVVHLDAGGDWGRRAIETIERLALPDIVDAVFTDVPEEDNGPEWGQAPEPQAPAPQLNAPTSDPDPVTDETWKTYQDASATAGKVNAKLKILNRNRITETALLEYLKELAEAIAHASGKKGQTSAATPRSTDNTVIIDPIDPLAAECVAYYALQFSSLKMTKSQAANQIGQNKRFTNPMSKALFKSIIAEAKADTK